MYLDCDERRAPVREHFLLFQAWFYRLCSSGRERPTCDSIVERFAVRMEIHSKVQWIVDLTQALVEQAFAIFFGIWQ